MKILKSHDVRAVLILIVLWVLFFWRLLTPIPEDQASFKQGDFSGQFVAFGAYQYDRVSDGEIPLWNPYNNGGLPFIADTQAAVFYPPRLLTIALATQFGGWSYHVLELEAIFHVLAYSLLMYLFIRRLTTSVWGAFVASIVAAYGGFISGYPPLQLALLEGAIWLPLVALCILEATRTNALKWRWIVFAGFSLGVSWLAGHPQTSWFLTYLGVAWLGYRIYSQKISWISFLGGTTLMGMFTLGTTAITFIPGIEYLTQTARTSLGYDAKGNGFPFQDVIQLIFPTSVSEFSPLYVGIPALILIFIASYYNWQKSRFWVIIAVFSLALSFGANGALFPALYNIMPGLSFFRGQERSAFLFANSLAIISGVGMATLTTWTTQHNQKPIIRLSTILLIVISAMTALIYIGWWGNVGDGFGRLISPAALSTMVVIGAWAFILWQSRSPKNRYALPLLCLLIVFELFSVNMDADSNYDSIPASDQLSMTAPELVQPTIPNDFDQPFRVDGFRGVQANYGSLYGIMDIRGISPLFLDTPSQIIYRDYVNNPRAWEIFSVRYIFSERDSFGQVDTTVITQGTDRDGQVFLHEITDPRPFAHLIYQYALVGSDDHALELLFDPNFPVRESVILQTDPTLSLPEQVPETGSAIITQFQPETITIDITTSENALLSLSLVDYSGWQATLNGQTVDILRAYGSLSAIEIPSGEHTLTLTYQPLSFRVGAIISIITWSITLVTLALSVFTNRNRETVS